MKTSNAVRSIYNRFFVVCFLAVLLVGAPAKALMVWGVESGASSATGSPSEILQFSLGVHSIDIYFDTEGEDVFGWDLSFLSPGASAIVGVSGPALGLGAAQVDGGYRQFGSTDLAITPINGASILMMTLNWSAMQGESLSLASSSNFSDNNFATQFLDSQTLASVAPVPLPPAMALFFVSISGLACLKRLPRVTQKNRQKTKANGSLI